MHMSPKFLISRSVMEENIRGEGVHKSKSNIIISDFDIELFSYSSQCTSQM